MVNCAPRLTSALARDNYQVEDAGHQLEALEFAFLAALETPVAVLDRDGSVVFLNNSFKKSGIVASQKPTSRFVDLFAPMEQSLIHNAIAAQSKQQLLLLHDGEYLRLTFTPMTTGGQDLSMCEMAIDHDADLARLRYLMDNLDHGIWDYDVQDDQLIVSPAWLAMRGHPANTDIEHLRKDWLDRIHPEDRSLLSDLICGLATGAKDSWDIQYRTQHTEGHWIWLLSRSKVVSREADGTPIRIVGTEADITAVKQKELQYQLLQRKLELTLEAGGIGLWEYDTVSHSVFWDDRMLDMYGITDGSNNRTGDSWETHLHPDDYAATVAYAEECQRTGSDFRRDYRIIRDDGSIRYIRSRAAISSTDEFRGKLIGLNIDVTDDYEQRAQLEAIQKRLHYESRHDALTGLANRRLLEERTRAVFEGAVPGQEFAILHADLDDFKIINDTYGHAAGDAVLVHVAHALQNAVGDLGTVCRTGGDEFVVLFESVLCSDVITRVAKDVLSQLILPINHEGHLLDCGISLGGAMGASSLDDLNDVVTDADKALYAAKDAGRGQFRLLRDGAFINGPTKKMRNPAS